jgi:hypothetical protein
MWGISWPSFAEEVESDNASTGRFLRNHWFEKGVEHGNPLFTSRFRVNAPEASLHPTYGKRSETTGNGMMQIFMQEDLFLLDGAELYAEIWGGHPGTINKRVTVNGRSTYLLPEVGTAAHNCTYMYPTIPLKLTDLVSGYNVFQFACDQGDTFWGHYIVDNACLRAELKKDHPDLEKAGLSGFEAVVHVDSAADEHIDLILHCSPAQETLIESVEFEGFYEGYDENGNGEIRDWHGFTKDRKPVAILGAATLPPFGILWDVSMIPDQRDMAARAIVRFKERPELLYVTPSTAGLQTPKRNSKVVMIMANDLPLPFWSRANRKETCSIGLAVEPTRIERAVHHVIVWDGGRGEISNYYTLNGHPLPTAGAGRHDVIYTALDVDSVNVLKGVNRIELLSDTEHHGIECLLPGPALMVRYRAQP